MDSGFRRKGAAGVAQRVYCPMQHQLGLPLALPSGASTARHTVSLIYILTRNLPAPCIQPHVVLLKVLLHEELLSLRLHGDDGGRSLLPTARQRRPLRPRPDGAGHLRRVWNLCCTFTQDPNPRHSRKTLTLVCSAQDSNYQYQQVSCQFKPLFLCLCSQTPPRRAALQDQGNAPGCHYARVLRRGPVVLAVRNRHRA